MYHSVKLFLRITELFSAQSQLMAVQHIRHRQIRSHPRVTHKRFRQRHRMLSECHCHISIYLQPGGKIIRCISYPFPLPLVQRTVPFRIVISKPFIMQLYPWFCIMPDILYNPRKCLFQLLDFCSSSHFPASSLRALIFLISRLSTNACTRVRSCPLDFA